MFFSAKSKEEWRLDIKVNFVAEKCWDSLEQVTKNDVSFYEITKPPLGNFVHPTNRVPTVYQEL